MRVIYLLIGQNITHPLNTRNSAAPLTSQSARQSYSKSDTRCHHRGGLVGKGGGVSYYIRPGFFSIFDLMKEMEVHGIDELKYKCSRPSQTEWLLQSVTVCW